MTATPTQRTLREAANAMREQHPMSHPRHEMWFALADLLDGEAKTPRGNEFINPQVVKVAQAYLSAVNRPDLDGDLYE